MTYSFGGFFVRRRTCSNEPSIIDLRETRSTGHFKEIKDNAATSDSKYELKISTVNLLRNIPIPTKS